MKAAQYVTGGDVIRLLNMPLGPVWRDRALLMIEAEAKAERIVSSRSQRTQTLTPGRGL